MATPEISQDAAVQEARIKELTEENELLFEQLHMVQEELEKYYHKLKECEARNGSSGVGTVVSVSPLAAQALAENRKLRVLVEQQKIALRVEGRNSLPSRLGDMLIKGVGSTGSLLALPGKLRKMWKAVELSTPPAALGGKSFQKVIDAHGAGGAEAVEKLLDSVFISPAMRANAYTALARHLALVDARKAAANARLAWETDPRPYRLKWLAFRMHDADDAITAEAMLDMLPADISMSESEQRQAMRIRQESSRIRNEEARDDAGLAGRAAGGNTNRPSEQASALQKAMDKHRREAEALKAELASLQALAAEKGAEIDALKARETELAEALCALREEAGTLRSERAEMKNLAEQQKKEAEILRARSEDLQKFAEEHKAEVARLHARNDELHQVYREEVKSISAQQKEILSAIASHGFTLNSNFEKHSSELQRVHNSIQQSCKDEIDNCLQQMVAYNGLSEYFGVGKLPEVTSWKRGWSARPDFILWQVELMDKNKYDLILEFGSGITTLYTAKALASREKHGSAAKSAQAVAFEHLEQFFLQTKGFLAQAGLGDSVNIVHAPLQEYTAPDGTAYQYYSCQEILSELSQQYKSSASRILVIVDGPPGGTNKNARYPAFPLVMKYFAPAHIDFLLDDYIRSDEKELAGMWRAACATAGIEHAVVEKELEKGAVLLRIAPAEAE